MLRQRTRRFRLFCLISLLFAEHGLSAQPTVVALEELGGHRYELYATSSHTSWAGARDFCSSRGGHLVTVSSEAEQGVLAALLDSVGDATPCLPDPDGYTRQRIWLGLSDHEEEGNWQWVTGEPVVYDNWDPGEPNNAGNEDYALINCGSTSGQNAYGWNDEDDSIRGLGFVCEYQEVYSDPWAATAACSNEIGCAMVLPNSIPWIQATGIALGYCGASVDFAQGRYARAGIGVVATTFDLLVFLSTFGGDPVPPMAGAVDCGELILDAWYDDVVAKGQSWMLEVEQALPLLSNPLPGLPDFSNEIWGLWVGSPVSLAVVNQEGDVVGVDGDDQPFLDPDFLALAVGFGDRKKMAMGLSGSGVQVSLSASGAAVSDSFSLLASEKSRDRYLSVGYLDVDLGPTTSAFLDLATLDVFDDLVIDDDGDGQTDRLEKVDFRMRKDWFLVDGFESGDATSWSSTVP